MAKEKTVMDVVEEEIARRAPIKATSSSHDAMIELATAICLDRVGLLPAEQKRPEGFAQHANQRLTDFLAVELKAQGIPVDENMREEIALQSLQLMKGTQSIPSVHAGGGSYQRPGDFPNLLANLIGKIIDQAMELAETTYERWTDRAGDLSDFKPRTMIGIGGFDELALAEDDDVAPSINANEELVGWLKIDRYNGKVGMTPVMLADDDMDAFAQMFMSLATAHDNTINRLCVDLLATNPLLLNGNNLFDQANHGNDVVAGGPPSIDQSAIMWQQWFQQTDVGNSNKTIKTPPAIVLYPAILDYTAKQVFSPFAGMVETKQAATDANLNPLRGQFELVREPELDSHSALMWYWLANPKRRRAFVHAFMRGYGRGGRRTSWFDPDRETRYVKIEGRFAAANVGHRGVVRNQGEDNS